MKPIYTVTCLNMNNRGDIRDRRCWGYHYDKKALEDAVKGNAADLFEQGWYQVAVVEVILPGICPAAKTVSCWHFTGKRVKPIGIPEPLAKVSNFAMG